jgi:LysR family hca operon transcriptional activator
VYPGVELRLYRYVTVLAEVLNFTRAAARLHVAQPALSKQIRQLEENLGAKLFERTKREVRLTAAGEAFTAEARLTLFHADRAVQGAKAARGLHRGPWSIGYSPLIDLRILSKYAAISRQLTPQPKCVWLVRIHPNRQMASYAARYMRDS